MPLPNSGVLTIAMIASEFGRTLPAKLTDFYGVAPGVPASGVIKMSDFYGKSSEFILNINSRLSISNLRQYAVNAGWNGASTLVVRISAEIASLAVDRSLFPGGVTLDITPAGIITGSNSGATALTLTGASGPLVLLKNAGLIRGAGGSGGKGTNLRYKLNHGDSAFNGNLAGGAGGVGQSFNAPSGSNSSPGATGATVGPSLGPSPTYVYHTAGSGGPGGTYGGAGTDGSNVVSTGNANYILRTNTATLGRAAGRAISGVSHLHPTSVLGSLYGGTV